MQDNLRIECLRNADDILAMQDQWDSLAEGVPFRRWDWLGRWWNEFAGNAELYVIAVRDSHGRLAAAAPFCRETTLASGRKLKLLGSGKVCSDYLTLMARPEHETELIGAMTHWLHSVAGDKEHGWDLLELENIPDCDNRWGEWRRQLNDLGNDVHTRAAIQCWRIDELDDWEDYLARLSKSHRKKIRRMLKRELTSEHIVARRADDEATFNLGWDALVDLHQRRWAARGIEGCFSCPKFTAFLHGAAIRFHQADRLDLTWLEDRGQPVAAQIDLVDGAGVFSYQAGIDPLVDDYSPGQVLQASMMHQAANNKVGRYDFLRGDEGYKASWRAVAVGCSTVRVTPNRTLPKIRSGAWSTGQTVKALLKSGLGRGEETSA